MTPGKVYGQSEIKIIDSKYFRFFLIWKSKLEKICKILLVFYILLACEPRLLIVTPAVYLHLVVNTILSIFSFKSRPTQLKISKPD